MRSVNATPTRPSSMPPTSRTGSTGSRSGAGGCSWAAPSSCSSSLIAGADPGGRRPDRRRRHPRRDVPAGGPDPRGAARLVAGTGIARHQHRALGDGRDRHDPVGRGARRAGGRLDPGFHRGRADRRDDRRRIAADRRVRRDLEPDQRRRERDPPGARLARRRPRLLRRSSSSSPRSWPTSSCATAARPGPG